MYDHPLRSLFAAGTLAVAGLIAAPAHAESDDDKNGYVNAAITRISDKQFDLDAFTLRTGYNFSDNFGVEGEVSLPTGTDDQEFVTIELDRVLAIFLTARINPTDRFELFARAGLIDSRVDVRIPAQNDAFEVDQRSAAVGGGVKVFFTDGLGLRAGYTYAESDTFDVGIEWRF